MCLNSVGWVPGDVIEPGSSVQRTVDSEIAIVGLDRKGRKGDQPSHVPRLSCPSVIGMEIVEPRREAFVYDTL
jgi:hypothetical protein